MFAVTTNIACVVALPSAKQGQTSSLPMEWIKTFKILEKNYLTFCRSFERGKQIKQILSLAAVQLKYLALKHKIVLNLVLL
jgi:hypothetical protein